MDSVEGKKLGRLTIPEWTGEPLVFGTEDPRSAFRTKSNVRKIC
jgi:hypothetical protein